MTLVCGIVSLKIED